MTNPDPTTLDSTDLARRLHELAGDERRVQVDFLLHLLEFDRRQAFLTLGFSSLWDYCLRALHLREGASGRRIGAMRVLRRFSALEAPLRDGRLSLSTATLLGQVLTEENLPDLVTRATFLTKADVEELLVHVRARAAPRDGIRKLAEPKRVEEPGKPAELARPCDDGGASSVRIAATDGNDLPLIAGPAAPGEDPTAATAGAPSARVERGTRATSRAELEPVAKDRWSLRVTLDGALKEELETLKMLLSHKVPSGDLTAVLREAIRCGVEKHGKRRGAVPPAPRAKPGRREPDPPATAPADPRAIPAAVRRQVWARDEGRCTYVAPDGRRCGSRWQLELDHVVPAGRGGSPTLDGLRLRCRGHNLLHAVEVYGREHMERFRRGSAGGAGPRSPDG